MPVYALKVDDGWSWLVREALKNGEGRFGWSYVETANLHDLRSRIANDGWNSLEDEEQDCYQELLLSLNAGDYVVYVNVPEWGQCTLAEVAGPYLWRWTDNDFNHRFPVNPDSVRSFHRNDPMVAPSLRARLALRGRCYRLHAEEEFATLAAALRRGVKPAPAAPADNQRDLAAAAEKIRHMQPHSDLERLVEQVFRRLPGVRSVTRQGATAGRGADLVVELEPGAIPQLVQTLVVQVRSDRGTVGDPAAVADIRRAFGACGADMVLVVSATATRDPLLERELDRLREAVMKPIAWLAGDELAAFFLRHGSDLLPE